MPPCPSWLLPATAASRPAGTPAGRRHKRCRGGSARDGQLTIAIGALPPTLDPHRTNGGGYFPYTWETFDGVLKRGLDATVMPGVGNVYKYNDDSSQLTVQLRQDVTFHNGDKLTAEDIQFSMDRMRDPSFKMAYAANFARITAVETPDANTVVFKSSAPFPELHQLLDAYFYIVPKKYASTAGDSFSTKPVGSGPYKVTNFVTDDRIEFEAFDGYWGDKAKTKKVVLRSIPEVSTAVAALEVGEVDAFFGESRLNSSTGSRATIS